MCFTADETLCFWRRFLNAVQWVGENSICILVTVAIYDVVPFQKREDSLEDVCDFICELIGHLVQGIK
jgi:hypothetical protein